MAESLTDEMIPHPDPLGIFDAHVDPHSAGVRATSERDEGA